jgi:hypothetical protein
MRRGLVLLGEQAGALQHHVHAKLAPRQLGRIALAGHGDAVTVHDDGAVGDLHRARELAVGGVVARQVAENLGVAKVVDRDHLHLIGTTAFVERAQHVAPDTAIPVDRHLDCHLLLS